MILVHRKPKIEADPQDGWQIIFWIGDDFDYSPRFREALAEIVTLLGNPDCAILELPPYTDNEDFVEGTLAFDCQVIGVYYEYSLSYLSLSSSSREVLSAVLKRVMPAVVVR